MCARLKDRRKTGVKKDYSFSVSSDISVLTKTKVLSKQTLVPNPTFKEQRNWLNKRSVSHHIDCLSISSHFSLQFLRNFHAVVGNNF